MTIELLRGVWIEGKEYAQGDVVDVADAIAIPLIAQNKAVKDSSIKVSVSDEGAIEIQPKSKKKKK